MTQRTVAISALLIVQLVFGVWPVVGALVLRHMTPAALVGVRVGLAGSLLLLATRPWQAGMNWREVLQCAGLGLLGVGANQALFIEGLSRSTPLNSAVLGCLIPAWTVAIALVLRQEQVRYWRLVGIGLALTGALVLVGVERFDLGPERTTGNLLLVGNTLCYSAYLVLSRPLLARHGTLPVVGWAFGLAVPLVVAYSWPSLAAVEWSRLPASTYASLLYIVLGPSLLAYVLNAWALRHVSASTVAVFVYLQPLVTGLAAGHVLGTRPGWAVLVATALIFSGVALVSRGAVRRGKAARAARSPES